MSSDNTDIKELEKKVSGISKEIEIISKSIEPLKDIPDILKKIDSFSKELNSLKSSIDNKSEFDDIKKAVESKDIDGLSSKIDTLTTNVEKIDDGVSEIKESKEMDVLYKKVDDLLIAVSDIGTKIESTDTSENIVALDEKVGNIETSISTVNTNLEQLRDSDESQVIGKKIEDLQQYVAGLSALEEKVDDLATAFTETKEIVGIIVRQLDDIERKYNKSIEEIGEAMEVVKALTNGGYIELSTPSLSTDKGKKTGKKGKDKEQPTIAADASTIDSLMKELLVKVKPQTEAKEMARILEDVRDRLTTMIKGHTPVLFQFGTRARELKSYPPTATLNENDIARLNKEIRDWTTKLKKIATER